MCCLSGPRGWLNAAVRTAVLASLAMLVSPLPAGESAPLPYRQQPSRYATKQVRIPGETSPGRVSSANGQVRAVNHTESMSRVVSRGTSYRTANRLRGAMPGEHSVVVQDGEMLMQGSAMMPEQIPTPMHDGEVFMEDGSPMPGGSMFTDGGCEGGACNDACGGCRTGNNCCLIPCPNIRFDKFEFMAGVDAFSGPLNRGAGGSFGFHEGLNWGSNLPCTELLSAQAGFQAIQSTFNGSDITEEDRRQFFVTAGLFRRVDWGLQAGAVVDFLHDEWYYQPLDLAQVRGEVSWVFPCNHELGVWFTQGINNGSANSTVQISPTASVTMMEGWHSTDLYAAFYRRQFMDCGAYGRVFGGFTGESDGLVGADFNVPLCESLALRSDFTYLIPGEGQGQNGNVEESWNVSIGLVWYPGCRTARSKDYNRPLFNVANNGSFMVDRD